MEFLKRIKSLFRSTPPAPELQPFEPLVESSNRRGKERRVARAGTRVLLIDDSATIVALLRRMLRQNEYLTLEAGDAERGIELARSERLLERTVRRLDPRVRAVPTASLRGDDEHARCENLVEKGRRVEVGSREGHFDADVTDLRLAQ